MFREELIHVNENSGMNYIIHILYTFALECKPGSISL